MRFYQDFRKYFKYAIYSARSELKSEVANSYLNWIWWVLEPTAFMFIYTFIFGTVFNAREPYFPVFIFIGLSVWDFFNKNMQNSVKMVRNNKSIVTKVYLPKFVLIMSKMMVNAFKMAISFGIVLTMMIFYQVPPSIQILWFVPIMVILFVFTFSLMTILLHFGVFVEDLSNIVTIGLRLVFYLTGIFYSVANRIPAPWGVYLTKANPMALILNSLRQILLYDQTPNVKYLLIWFVISVVISVIGIRTIYKNENGYVKVI